jgi:hypothetical protein
MTAPTYTFAADFSLVRDQIRQMIGDTAVTTDPLNSDEAIAFFYIRAGNDLIGGAILAARAAAAKLALECDVVASKAQANRSQRHVAMLDTIAQLEAERFLENFGFESIDVGKVADSENYPKAFESTDLGGQSWEADE